jgi:hypothetical protein
MSAMHYNVMQEIRVVQDQLTVRLPADLSQALRRASRQLQRRNSDVVRLALRAYLHVHMPGDARPADRVRHLLGSVSSGQPDLAERHRAYILESLARGR